MQKRQQIKDWVNLKLNDNSKSALMDDEIRKLDSSNNLSSSNLNLKAKNL